MPTKTNPKIVFESINVELKRVNYDRLEDITDQYEIKVNNDISPKSIDENGFVLKTYRKLYFEPNGAFNIYIEYDIICKFDEKSKNFYNGSIEEIKKFIEKRKVEIFNNSEVGHLMSILISQITLVNNHNPIVSPPFMINEEGNRLED